MYETHFSNKVKTLCKIFRIFFVTFEQNQIRLRHLVGHVPTIRAELFVRVLHFLIYPFASLANLQFR